MTQISSSLPIASPRQRAAHTKTAKGEQGKPPLPSRASPFLPLQPPSDSCTSPFACIDVSGTNDLAQAHTKRGREDAHSPHPSIFLVCWQRPVYADSVPSLRKTEDRLIGSGCVRVCLWNRASLNTTNRYLPTYPNTYP